MNAKNTIAGNFPECGTWDKNSFVSILHEQQLWSHVQYSFVFRAIGSHLDNEDLFEIKNLSRDEVYSFRERVDLMFAGVFRRRMPNQSIFKLINPLMK